MGCRGLTEDPFSDPPARAPLTQLQPAAFGGARAQHRHHPRERRRPGHRVQALRRERRGARRGEPQQPRVRRVRDPDRPEPSTGRRVARVVQRRRGQIRRRRRRQFRRRPAGGQRSPAFQPTRSSSYRKLKSAFWPVKGAEDSRNELVMRDIATPLHRAEAIEADKGTRSRDVPVEPL